ncbi:MAG TPA: hypothetical protein VFO05_16800 [Candidatus Limnocylindrales bacterium]|nr:hypothetical protein [Candidatus Limnocylindrales bacterium]
MIGLRSAAGRIVLVSALCTATIPVLPPATVEAATRPFALSLYEPGDFVSQARGDWCVPGAIQTMANLVARGQAREGAVPSQGRLDRLARSLSTDRLVGPGSEPEGWAGGLEELGLGPYEVVSVRTRDGAVAAAARAMALTRRPVGLLMWRGAHAWVMSGFEATANPATTADFVVTHVRVLDPWYPRTSSIWGAGQRPDTRIATSKLAADLLPWRRPAVRYAEKDGQFVLVLPVADPSPARILRPVTSPYLVDR